MKYTIIISICFFLVFGASAQNNERYEFARFQVSQGLSNGAVFTDFVFAPEKLSSKMQADCREVFFSKDLVFDVVFLTENGNDICRVYHLEELSQDDVKVLFIKGTESIDFSMEPIKFYKITQSDRD